MECKQCEDNRMRIEKTGILYSCVYRAHTCNQPERSKREDHYIGGYFLPPWNLNEHPEKTEGWIAFQEEQRKNPKYYGCGTTIYTTTGVAN